MTLFCFVVGCGSADDDPPAGTADPIIGGEADTGDPSVVALYTQPLGSMSGYLCTGSVIAPTVILTAAHCVSPAEVGSGAKFVVLTSANVNRRGGQQLEVREVRANPLWRPQNLAAGHDEGIVILKEPTSLAPLPFNRDTLPDSAVGSPVRLVGYGLNDGVEQTGSGIKRQALTRLRSITAALIRVGDSRRGTCNGDSGGPAFMDIRGVETIVGTTSYGNATCSDGGYNARVDVDVGFIEPFLAGDGCDRGCEEQEPNDAPSQANALGAGGERRGTPASADDQDWFVWTVAAGSMYDARLTPGASGAVLRVYKLSATSRLSFIGDGPDVSRHSPAGGTYVARITGVGPSTDSYALKVSITR